MKPAAGIRNQSVSSISPRLNENAQQMHPLGEDHFHQAISLEKKRAERSGNPALLMRIDFRNFDPGTERDAAMSLADSVLTSVTRETDIRGWFKNGTVLGVVFTELGDCELGEAQDRIYEKIHGALNQALGESRSRMLRITCEFLSQRYSWARNNGKLHLNSISAPPADPEAEWGFGQAISSNFRKMWFLVFADVWLIGLGNFLGIWSVVENASVSAESSLAAFGISILLYLITFYILDLYNLEKVSKPRQIASRTAMAALSVALMCAVVFHFVPQWHYSNAALLLQMLLASAFLIGWRMAYCRLFQVAKAKLPTLVLGGGEVGNTAKDLLNSPVSPFEFKGFLDDRENLRNFDGNGTSGRLGSISKLSELIVDLGIKAIVVALPRTHYHRITRKILEVRFCGIEIIDMPTLYERLATRLPVEYVEDQWLLFSDGFSLISKQYVQKIKRILDFVFSGILLIAVLPIMALTAIAIRIDSSGPVFYKQQRVGKRGKVFTVCKFRSMCCDAEKHGAKWAQKNDSRVTRVGKWIRLFRIDELPQIWNVFTGDMSLVGPRPERPEFVRDLEAQIPYYCVRHTVTPGITGWAQIKYQYGASVDDSLRKLEYDLYYIKNMSLLFDLKILLRTVGVVLLGEGAR